MLLRDNLLGDPHATLKPHFSGITPQGAPHWWLAGHGWTNRFEAAALADPDEDGMASWQEFMAGTSPSDALSVFKVACAKTPGPAVALRWPSMMTRSYAVYRSTNLANEGLALLTNNLPPTAPTNHFADPSPPTGPAFYRIEVRTVR